MTAGKNPDVLWLNGELVPWDEATIHMTFIGTGAVAVFEGTRGYWNQEQEQLYVFRLDRHLERLGESMKIMGMTTELTTEQMKRGEVEVLRAVGVREDSYIRPLAFFTEGREVGTGGGGDATVLIHTHPVDSILGTDTAMKVCVSSWTRISDNVMPARIKCLANYHNGGLAAAEAARNGYDWAILLTPQGKVSEAPGACLMMVRKGMVITPPITAGILESVTRQTLLEVIPEELGVAVCERDVDRTELYIADEVFLCGTGREVTPVTHVDKYPVGQGTIGPLTSKIAALFETIVRGTTEEHPQWRTPVW